MINLTFQGLAVFFRALLIFVFIFFISKNNEERGISNILALFTYSSIFANIICFGFDYYFVQNTNSRLKLDSFSFLTKIGLGVLIACVIIYIQNLSPIVLFYAISFSLPLIFKGYIRLSREHKLDFAVNLSALFLFLSLVFLYQEKIETLTLLSISIFIPFSILLIKKLNFNSFKLKREVFKSVFNSSPLMIYSLLAYLLLNVDLYVFKFWDKIDVYANFAISNKFFMNITMIPVVLANYRIGFIFEGKTSQKSIFREFLALGIVLAFISFISADFFIGLIGNDKIFISISDKLLFSFIIFLRTINTYYGLKVLKILSNWVRLYSIIVILIVHLILLFVFIHYSGWQGAIYALALSSLVFVVLNLVILRKNGGSK